MRGSLLPAFCILVSLLSSAWANQKLVFNERNFSVEVADGYQELPLTHKNLLYDGLKKGDSEIMLFAVPLMAFSLNEALVSKEFQSHFESSRQCTVSSRTIEEMNGYRFLVVKYTSQRTNGICYFISADDETIAFSYVKLRGYSVEDTSDAQRFFHSFQFLRPPKITGAINPDTSSKKGVNPIFILLALLGLSLIGALGFRIYRAKTLSDEDRPS